MIIVINRHCIIYEIKNFKMIGSQIEHLANHFLKVAQGSA